MKPALKIWTIAPRFAIIAIFPERHATNPICRDGAELKNSSHTQICSLGTKEPLGCYLQIIGDSYKRGCMEDLLLPLQQYCHQSKTCKSCIGKNCNEKDSFHKCHVCNSTYDSGCAQNITDESYSTVCPNYLSSCSSEIDEFGYTHRRCVANVDLDSAKNGLKVETCEENDCNNNLFPKNLQCYQCNGELDCTFSKTNSSLDEKLKACNVIVDNERCFTYLDTGNMTLNSNISILFINEKF